MTSVVGKARRPTGVGHAISTFDIPIEGRHEDLETVGVIRRDADPVDARASLISLTDSGRATLGRIRDARCGILAEALHDMDPDLMATAADALTRIATAVERSRADRPLVTSGPSTSPS